MIVKVRSVFLIIIIVLLSTTLLWSESMAAVTVLPWDFAEGTIVDDNGDGIPDTVDITFDGSGEEVSGIQLELDPSTLTPIYESRVFFEYKLNTVTFGPPVLARLTFALRGATIWNVNADVQVYSYPSDLLVWPDNLMLDFAGEPAVLEGAASVSALDSETEFSICVSDAVNTALSSGSNGVAFRFQIDPASEAIRSNAHVVAKKAEEENPEEKPLLSISVPGDTNGDLVVDLTDMNAFGNCLRGPGAPSPFILCRALDLDCDGDTDLSDFALFQAGFTGTP